MVEDVALGWFEERPPWGAYFDMPGYVVQAIKYMNRGLVTSSRRGKVLDILHERKVKFTRSVYARNVICIAANRGKISIT